MSMMGAFGREPLLVGLWAGHGPFEVVATRLTGCRHRAQLFCVLPPEIPGGTSEPG